MTARALAHEVTTVFSLPDVTLRLNQLLASPRASNAAIGEVVISDPALTARVLELANSGFCALPHPVSMVSEAIALLGREALRDLVFATSVTSTFQGIPPELVDMERFWLNSVACGVIARSLAFRCRIFDNEPLFIAGLLHKVGRLVFYSLRPDEYRRVLAVRDQGEEAINRAERSVFGFTHAELGAELLGRWGLPDRLRLSVAHYLDPSLAPGHRRSAAFIHVASALAGSIEPGVSLDEAVYEDQLGFARGAWNLLGLSVETVPTILSDAWVQSFEMFEILRPPRA